jgi:prophage tail gpP-like protein
MADATASVPDVRLLVNAQEISGWTSIRISKSLEKLAHDFDLGLTNQRVTALSEVAQIKAAADVVEEDDKVRVRIKLPSGAGGGDIVVTGYVDETSLEYDASSVSFRVTGTSRTGDLVDSSAIYQTGVWNSASIDKIIADLCDPFGLTVLRNGSAGPDFQRFKLEQGETVFEAMSRACSMRGFLPLTDAEGNVVLDRASKAPSGAVIELGNVLSGGITRSRRERFSKYIFKGQTAASDEWSGKEASQLENEVDDPDVDRYRPMVVLAAKQKTKEDLGKRAVWERNVRAGRSLRVQYTVEGWTNSVGQLWEPNMLVHVSDEWCGIDQDLLVTSVDLLLDEQYVTQLELMDRSAFDVEPVRPTKKAR